MVTIGWPTYVLCAIATLCDVSSIKPLPTECVRNMGKRPDPYVIFDSRVNRYVRCDTHTDGGGWIIVQRRDSYLYSFEQNWDWYKHGFGTPWTNVWLGNEALHRLTSNGIWELRFEIEDSGVRYHLYYPWIQVDKEDTGYRIRLSGEYSGTFDDNSMLECTNGMKFSTFDHSDQPTKCNRWHHSGWWHFKRDGCRWFYHCTNTNINGLWRVETLGGVFWMDYKYYGWHPGYQCFQRWAWLTEMKIRRRM